MWRLIWRSAAVFTARPNRSPAATSPTARGDHENFALAASIILIIEAERGEFDKSVVELKEFLKQRTAADISDEHRLPAPLVCAVGEAYLQRLGQWRSL